MSHSKLRKERATTFANGLQRWLQGDVKEAERMFRQAIKSAPWSLPAYMWLATLFIRQRRFAEAKQFASAGLTLAARRRKSTTTNVQDEDLTTVSRSLKRLNAVASAHLGSMERSIAKLTLLHTRDRDLDAAIDLGGLLVEAGRLREAEDIYLEAAGRAAPPVASTIYTILGQLKEQLGDRLAAKNDFARAWKAAPSDPVTCLRYSRVLTEAGQPLMSVETLQDGIRRNPNDSGLLTTLAFILATATCRWSDSLRYLKRAARVSKQNPDALCMIGHTRACMYDYTGALEDFLNAARIQDSATFSRAFSVRDLRAFRRWAREHEDDLGSAEAAGRFAAVLAAICDTFDFDALPFGPGYVSMDILKTVPGSANVLSQLIAEEHRLKHARRGRVLFSTAPARTARRAA